MRVLRLLIFLALGTGLLVAQTAPIKMGLWEKKMITTGATAAPATLTAKSCVTPETWQQMVSNTSKQQPGCAINTSKTGHGYTFNGSCTLPQGGSVVMNGSTSIQDSEHIVSESHSTMTFNGQTRKMDSHSTSRFVSSSCGAVKPGDPQIQQN